MCSLLFGGKVDDAADVLKALVGSRNTRSSIASVVSNGSTQRRGSALMNALKEEEEDNSSSEDEE